MLAIVRSAAAALLYDRDPRASCESTDRGREIDVLVIHHEPENAPACSATEAVERLPRRADMKGGRFFLMKRAERAEVCSRAFERKIQINCEKYPTDKAKGVATKYTEL